MTEIVKLYIGKCIKKYRRLNYTQEELAESICSKYTLSRLENGIPCKSKIYHELLNKLGFYFNDCFDIININLLFKDIVSAIIINDFDTVYNAIDKIDSIVSKYEKHIYFVEIKVYVSYMRMHYIKKTKILFDHHELEPLPLLDKNIRICMKHLLCENLLFSNDNIGFKTFLQTFDLKQEHHILTDYFVMIDYQYESLMIKTHTVFKNYIHTFVEENNYYQSIRFNLVYALGFINKNCDTAIKMLEKVKLLDEKSKSNSEYMFIYYFSYIIIYSRQNQLEKAYILTLEGIGKFPKMSVRFIPYLIILSLILKKDVADEYLIPKDDLFCNSCIHLYSLKDEEINAEKKMLAFINRYTPKFIGKDNARLPLINLFRRKIIQLVEISFCYHSALIFDALIKKYTNEKEY